MSERSGASMVTRSAGETRELGELLGRCAAPGTCLALHGELGAGKTQLAGGIAEGARVDDPTLVASPTYVLLNIYAGPKPVYHLDAYRIRSEEDFAAVGFEEVLEGGGITVVEWAEKIPHLLPAERLDIFIELGEEPEERLLRLVGRGVAAEKLVGEVAAAWPHG